MKGFEFLFGQAASSRGKDKRLRNKSNLEPLGNFTHRKRFCFSQNQDWTNRIDNRVQNIFSIKLYMYIIYYFSVGILTII